MDTTVLIVAAVCASLMGLSAILAARSGSRSIATAVVLRAALSHSMAMAPEPAPTSISRWPGSGARAARLAARTSRLVDRVDVRGHQYELAITTVARSVGDEVCALRP